jgi:hypothetical protein
VLFKLDFESYKSHDSIDINEKLLLEIVLYMTPRNRLSKALFFKGIMKQD